jgi:hypothetical protein
MLDKVGKEEEEGEIDLLGRGGGVAIVVGVVLVVAAIVVGVVFGRRRLGSGLREKLVTEGRVGDLDGV